MEKATQRILAITQRILAIEDIKQVLLGIQELTQRILAIEKATGADLKYVIMSIMNIVPHENPEPAYEVNTTPLEEKTQAENSHKLIQHTEKNEHGSKI